MIKRIFDFLMSAIGLGILLPILFLLVIIAALETRSFGIFTQIRVGQYGKPFLIYKIQTYHSRNNTIGKYSQFLRAYKLDELPQLFNILKGDMSFVGPRPDLPGYYDRLEGEERKLLELKPGLTSEASIFFRNEESLLEAQDDPKSYNDTVLFPQKVKMNLVYYHNRSFLLDLKIILKTIFPR